MKIELIGLKKFKRHHDLVRKQIEELVGDRHSHLPSRKIFAPKMSRAKRKEFKRGVWISASRVLLSLAGSDLIKDLLSQQSYSRRLFTPSPFVPTTVYR